jgi:hypothetical protein
VSEVICSSICRTELILTGMNLCRVELPWPVRICVGFSHFDRYESLWGWATLTSRKVCRVELPWPARMSVGWATMTSKNRCRGWATLAGTNLRWVELSYRFESLPSWPILTEHFHGFPQSLKTTAGHISNYITIVSFEVLCTSLLITLRIDVSVNYCQRHYRNHNLEQTHSYT